MATKISRELAGYLRRQPKAFSVAIEAEVSRQAERLAAAQRSALGGQLQPPEDTGGGMASIRVEQGADHLTKIVSAGGPLTTKNGYDHMLAFEFGTQRQPPRPFFYSTARVMEKSIRSAIESAVERTIDGKA